MAPSGPWGNLRPFALGGIMAITQREAFAQVMEHLVTHNGNGGHG